jgi:hypothetical protein
VPICEPLPELVQRAIDLGNNDDVIRSYERVQGTDDVLRSQNWFFSKNDALAGATKKPMALPNSWQAWRQLTFQQRIVLGNLGGFDANSVAATDANLAKIANAFGLWPDDLLAVFWGSGLPDGGVLSQVNTCNLFVGETLFSDGKKLMTGNKYANASAIFNARDPQSPLRFTLERIPVEHAQPGDIVAWSVGHVEILSSVDAGAGTFCSIGAFRPNMGKEACGKARPDGGFPPEEQRQLGMAAGEQPLILFYRWCVQDPEQPAERQGCRGCSPWRFGTG